MWHILICFSGKVHPSRRHFLHRRSIFREAHAQSGIEGLLFASSMVVCSLMPVFLDHSYCEEIAKFLRGSRNIWWGVYRFRQTIFCVCHEFQALQLLSNSLSSVSLAQNVACQFAIVRYAIPRSNLLGTRIWFSWSVLALTRTSQSWFDKCDMKFVSSTFNLVYELLY